MFSLPNLSRRHFLTLSAGAMLSACSDATQFNPQTSPRLHSIDLIPPHGPFDYVVGSNGTMFTASGFGQDVTRDIQYLRRNDKTNIEFRAQMADAGLDLSAELTLALIAEFAAKGLVFNTISASHIKPGAFVENVAALGSKADAVLDIVIISAGYAYVTGHPYEPRVDIKVRLSNSKTNAVLYDDSFSYMQHWNPDRLNVLLTPDPGYNFRGGGELLADPRRAAAGIRSSVPSLVKAIGTGLHLG